MDVSFAVIVVQAPDMPLVADLIVSLEALDVLPLLCSFIIHLSFPLLVLFGVIFHLIT